MASDSAKRPKFQRQQNWDDNERAILFDLVKSHMDIVENKQADTNITKMKLSSWTDIHKNFCLLVGKENRAIGKLREQWHRMKQAAKKNISMFLNAQKRTGGGSNEVKVTSMDWAIKEALPHIFVEDHFSLDSDGHYESTGLAMNPPVNTDPLDEISILDNVVIAYSQAPSPSTPHMPIAGCSIDVNAPLIVNCSPSSDVDNVIAAGSQQEFPSPRRIANFTCIGDSSQQEPQLRDIVTPHRPQTGLLSTMNTMGELRGISSHQVTSNRVKAAGLKRKKPVFQYGGKYEETLCKMKAETHALKLKLMKDEFDNKEKREEERHQLLLAYMKKEHEYKMRKLNTSSELN